MKRYGFNWLLLVLGTGLLISPFSMWLRFTGELLLHPNEPTDWSGIKWFGYQQALFLCCLTFVGAYTKYKKRSEAQQALEGNQGAIEREKEHTMKLAKAASQKRVTPKQALFYIFGAVSAIVGTLSLVAHLTTGRVSVAEVIGFTLGIPLCCAAGAWLTDKAELKEPQNEATLHVTAERVYGMPTYVPLVKKVLTDEEQAPLINRRG